jgi:hypothetical protein
MIHLLNNGRDRAPCEFLKVRPYPVKETVLLPAPLFELSEDLNRARLLVAIRKLAGRPVDCFARILLKMLLEKMGG